MKIEVECEPPARAELLDLLSRRTTSVLDTLLFAGVYLDDLTRLFVAHEGDLPSAVQIQRADGSRWWWRYVRGVWVS